MKRLVVIGGVGALIALGAIAWWRFGFQTSQIEEDQPIVENTAEQPQKPADKTDEAFDKQMYSLKDPSSIWVVVNKQNSIPVSFRPNLTVPNVRLRLAASEQQMQVSEHAASAIEKMFTAATQDGITLVFGSGYRSGSLQQQFYNSYVAKDGQAAADRYSARPGHSEHQTGLGVDITSPDGRCHLQICWESTPQGKWIVANAYKYGFTLRYQKGKEAITGYQYEPWHFRFVGKELAGELQRTGQTIEEFFGLPPAPSYD